MKGENRKVLLCEETKRKIEQTGRVKGSDRQGEGCGLEIYTLKESRDRNREKRYRSIRLVSLLTFIFTVRSLRVSTKRTSLEKRLKV